MGLMLSVILSYAGVMEAIECMNHIMSGMVPDTEPDFRDLVEYYNMMLRKCTDEPTEVHWAKQSGQGYLCLTEDAAGKLESASLKYYDDKTDSAAILFSTKISSFGQESVENTYAHANGNCKSERSTPTRTKTITTDNLSSSFIVGQPREKSPIPEISEKTPDTDSRNVTDPNRLSSTSHDRHSNESDTLNDSNEKLTWHYRPRSPVTPPLPEINFQPIEGEKGQDNAYSEDYLRSLDGIKLRPLQRSDPSGKRRSYRKRNSSSSNSSRESRASREEELRMFTSLEEAEFEQMNRSGRASGCRFSPNSGSRSHSRSRSREDSKERRNDAWSLEASVDSVPEDTECTNALAKSSPKLNSSNTEDTQVMEEEEEDVDFWGNSGD